MVSHHYQDSHFHHQFWLAATLRIPAVGLRICDRLASPYAPVYVGKGGMRFLFEVLLHISHQPFHGTFGKWMGDLAQRGLETYQDLEYLVFLVPNRCPVGKPLGYDTFHVVRKYCLRNPHHHEGMKHADEQVFLFCRWKVFDVPETAVVADHRKACTLPGFAETVATSTKAPVHLKHLTGAWYTFGHDLECRPQKS